MSEYLSRIKIENRFTGDSDRFQLTLNCRNIVVTDQGQLVVWATKDEIESLKSDCEVALREDDGNGPRCGLNFGQEL